MAEFVEIDGNVLEGGGQILRMATVFSCLLRKPIRIHSIRAGRGVGGLRPQHLTGLRTVRDLCQGQLKGDEVGSREIFFTPGPIKGGLFKADCGTAGSITLLMQICVPIALFARDKVTLELKGGTDVMGSPPISHTTHVLRPTLNRFGVDFFVEIVRRGFYPKGGGEVRVSVEPIAHVKAVELLDVGQILKIGGESWTAGVLPPKVAERMTSAAVAVLKRNFPQIPIGIESVKLSERDAFGTGCGISLMAQSTSDCQFGSSALGAKGTPAEKVGEEAGVKLSGSLGGGGCVDEFLQDQLIVYMALAKGESKIRCGPITLHTTTAIHIAQLLTRAKFRIVPDREGEEQSSVVIECEGVGFCTASLL